MLQLFALGIEDIQTFDFMDKPSQEVGYSLPFWYDFCLHLCTTVVKESDLYEAVSSCHLFDLKISCFASFKVLSVVCEASLTLVLEKTVDIAPATLTSPHLTVLSP